MCSRTPVAMLNCHCRDCQHSSGAPFASGVIVLVSDTEIRGTPKTYSVRAHSGSLATRVSVPIVAFHYSREAKLLLNLCPSAFPRWTISRSFSRGWTSGHPVRNLGFVLVRKFLTMLRRLNPGNSRSQRSGGEGSRAQLGGDLDAAAARLSVEGR